MLLAGILPYMTGKTHQIIGITVGLGYMLLKTSPQYSPATLACVLVGSHIAALIPDLDRASSMFWNSLPMGKVAGYITDPFIKHRNISHSVLGTVIFYAIAHYLFSLFPIYWGVNIHIALMSSMIAYCSHCIADMITVQGIPLLFPYKRMFGFPPKPFHGVRIVTGKWFENLVVFPIINIILIALIWTNWDTLRVVLTQ